MLRSIPWTAALIGALAAATAQADPAVTRNEVRAETRAAIRNGELVEPSGQTFRDMFPDRYPAQPALGGASREAVAADTRAAIDAGEMTMPSGTTPREMYPGRYPAAPVMAGLSREAVKAELARAVRDGDMMATGRADLTLREEFPQEYGAQ